MIIYCAKNRNNGKCYVGKTERSLEQRWKEHVYGAMSGDKAMPLYAAIRKHGKESFDLSMLQECEDTTGLNVAERRWIEELGTFRVGYNATLGGDGISGYRHTEDAKRRMSEARKGEKNHNFGKKGWGRTGPYAEETKRKLSEAHKGSHHTEEVRKKIGVATSIRKRKRVAQVSEEGTVLNVYPSLQEAARAIGGQANKISEVLCGHRRTHKGYLWQYVLDCGKAADRVEV